MAKFLISLLHTKHKILDLILDGNGLKILALVIRRLSKQFKRKSVQNKMDILGLIQLRKSRNGWDVLRMDASAQNLLVSRSCSNGVTTRNNLYYFRAVEFYTLLPYFLRFDNYSNKISYIIKFYFNNYFVIYKRLPPFTLLN